MTKVFSHFITLISVAAAASIFAVINAGYVLPHGAQLLYSSADIWQGDRVNIYALDLQHNFSRPLFISRNDNVPGLPMIWSPDGKYAAYLLHSPHLQTYLLDLGAMQFRLLAEQPDDQTFNAEWSPDSQQLAFVGIRDGISGLYLAEADGSHIQQISLAGSGYKNLAWSPDSTRIALETGAVDEDIALVNTRDGSSRTVIQDTAKNIRPAWSPDGKWLAFFSSREGVNTGGTRFDLYVKDVTCDSCPVRRLTDDFPAGSTWQIRWSPDGARLLMASTEWMGGNGVFLVDVASSQVMNVSEVINVVSNPVWSPDGSQFAYEAYQNGYWSIYIASADGQPLTHLSSSYNQRRPVWSADGKQLTFIADPQRNWDIYLMDVLGKNIRRLTDAASIEYSPVWRPS